MLEKIKILDLSRILAGPYCTQMLGDLGAQITKIEHIKGDDTRAWGPPFFHKESAYFLAVNRNKKSVTLNFKSTKGLEILKKMVVETDILVENYVPGKLDSLGLGYDELKKLNPRLIYASITGYGPEGPFAHKAGYDVIIEGEAGLMHITGEENPVKVGVAITDITTGLYAKGAILAALIAREQTGKGQKIDISLLECQVASLANVASNYLIGGKEGKRMGSQHSSIVPYQSFSTKDAFLNIGAGNDNQYSKLCSSIGRNDLISSEYESNSLRVQNRQKLIPELQKTFKSKTTREWLEILQDSGLPFGPINTIKQTFEHPQVLARNMIKTVEHKLGPIKLVGIPVKYSESKPEIRLPPPLLGQHTEEVLKDLGYSSTEIQNFKAGGVV